MTVQELVSRVRQTFPNVSQRQVIALVNDAIQEFPDAFSGRYFLKRDVVEGQRYYTLPDYVFQIESVSYQDADGDYQELSRLVGSVNQKDPS